jgi:DNA polymerase I-like protein with 3'-5' exonuclease and polymerase domains
MCLTLAKLPREAVLTALNLQGATCVVGYDAKSTLKTLLGMGAAELPAVAHDVLVAAFNLNSLIRAQSLTDLAASELGYGGSPFEDLSDEELLGRGSEIVAVIRALAARQHKALQELPSIQQLTTTVDYPVIPVLARMEYTGYSARYAVFGAVF